MINSEQPLFFKNRAGAQLYGILHRCVQPEASSSLPAVIIYCHPFGEEKMHAHRVAVGFSRFSQNNGVSVFRFDYFGCGDSEGLSEENTLKGMVEDIEDAVGFVREQFDECRVFLLGLRLGATMAILASCGTASVDGIIAWEPVVKLRDYFYQGLRMNLTWQMTVFSEIRQKRDELIRCMSEGEIVNVEGFSWSPGLFSEAELLDESGLAVGEGVPVLLVSIGSKPVDVTLVRTADFTPAGRVESIVIQDRQFWKPLRKVYPDFAELFHSTLSWCDSTGGESLS